MIPACDKSVSFFIPANQHHTHYYSGMLMPSCSHFTYNNLIINSLHDYSKNINPEKPDVPLNKNDAFQKVQKRRVQEKR